MRWQHVMVIGNIKGALSMAAVLTLPEDFPYRERLVTIVFGVTFVTLVMQALPFQRILRALKVTLDRGEGGSTPPRPRWSRRGAGSPSSTSCCQPGSCRARSTRSSGPRSSGG